MPFYEWSESMSVGVPLLDDDNKRIIGIINQLHECLQHGSPTDVVNEIFDSLIAYFEFHFSREEKVIEACGYPHAKAHQEEHVEFTEHMYQLRGRQLSGAGPAIDNELVDYLKNWLNHHILILDMGYRSYVLDHPVAEQVAWAFGSWFVEEGEDRHAVSIDPGAAIVNAL